MSAAELNFGDWLGRDELLAEGLVGDIGDWLGRLRRSSRVTYDFLVSLLRRAPELHIHVAELPRAIDAVNRDPVLRQTFLNDGFLKALRGLADRGDLSRDKILADCEFLKAMLDRVGSDEVVAEHFWRSSAGKFVQVLWKFSHLGPVFSRLPQVTVANAWATLLAFREDPHKGVRAAVGAVAELVHYLFSAGLMTGMLGKLFFALQFTNLGLMSLGGAWIAWALVSLLGRSSGNLTGGVLSALVKFLDPAASLNLVKHDDAT